MPLASHSQSEALKSTPDVPKINGMTSRIVMVTRATSKNGAGQLVHPAKKNVNLDYINELHTTLPREHGPGTYRFEVFDEGGPDRDTWVVKLGPDVPDGANGAGTPYIPNAAAAAANAGPDGPVLLDIGHGYLYRADLGLLTTPQKQVYRWNPSQPLPTQLDPNTPQVAAQPQPFYPGAPATPVGQFPMFQPWGSIPVTPPTPTEDPTSKRQIELLQEQLRNEREARVEEARRREANDMRLAYEKMNEENNKRFELLLAKLSEQNAKPTGPSPIEEGLKSQLDLMRQQLQEQRNREEARAREETLRAEMRASQENSERMMRELQTQLTANKSDPMITILGQMMSGQNQSAIALAQAFKDTAEAQADASKENTRLVADRLSGSVLTPDRTVELIRLAKDRTADGAVNQGMIDMFKTTFGMAQDVIRMQSEAMGQASGPAWMPIAQQGVEAIGRVATLYATVKQQEQQNALRMAQMQQQPRGPSAQQIAAHRQRQAQMLAQRQAQLQAQAQAHALRMAAPAPESEPEDEEDATEAEILREAAAQQVFGPGSATSAAREAAAQQVFSPRAEAPAAPANVPVAAPTPAAPAVEVLPAPQSGVDPIRRRRRKNQPPAAQVIDAASTPQPAPQPMSQVGLEAADDEASAPQAQQQQQQVDISKIPAANLRAVTDQLNDQDFFGDALSQVEVLRQTVAAQQLPPPEVANAVLMSRQYFMTFGQFPPAIELLHAGQLEILADRLLPNVPADFRQEVIESLHEALETERRQR